MLMLNVHCLCCLFNVVNQCYIFLASTFFLYFFFFSLLLGIEFKCQWNVHSCTFMWCPNSTNCSFTSLYCKILHHLVTFKQCTKVVDTNEWWRLMIIKKLKQPSVKRLNDTFKHYYTYSPFILPFIGRLSIELLLSFDIWCVLMFDVALHWHFSTNDNTLTINASTIFNFINFIKFHKRGIGSIR